MKNVKSTIFSFSLLSGVFMLGGCGVVSSFVIKTAERALTGKNNSRRLASHALEKQLTPLNSGPGLVVFEPLSNTSNRNFAKGCGRWLFVQAAGGGEFGQTPGWGVVAEVARVLKFPDLQLEKSQALQHIQLAGVTHAATGKLENSGSGQKLTYQVWKVDGKPAGAPLSISGTPAQIVQQLPILAGKIEGQISGKTSKIPPCELKPAELSLIGRAERKPRVWPSANSPLVRALKSLAPHSALASILWWRNAAVTKTQAESLFGKLAAQISGNAMVLCDFSRIFSQTTSTHETAMANLLKKYPNNSLLHAAQRQFYFENGAAARNQARQSAEMEMRTAPKSYLAWFELGEVIQQQADDVRKARFATQMSAAEAQKVYSLYPLWLEADQKAVSLNPLNSQLWSDLSTAAVFNNDNLLGDQAMATALKLDPLNANAYRWAFQMYQPKWGGSRASFFQYANQAIANAGKMEVPTVGLFEGYRAWSQASQIPMIAAKLMAANPRDAAAIYEYAADLHYQQRAYNKAEPLYRKVLALNPQHGRCLSSLADLQTWVHGDNKASEALYRKAIAAEPNDGFHHANLARLLNRMGRRPEALKELDAARNLGFHGSHPVWQEMGERP